MGGKGCCAHNRSSKSVLKVYQCPIRFLKSTTCVCWFLLQCAESYSNINSKFEKFPKTYFFDDFRKMWKPHHTDVLDEFQNNPHYEEFAGFVHRVCVSSNLSVYISVYFRGFRKGMIFPVLYTAPAFVHGDLSVSTFRFRFRLTVSGSVYGSVTIVTVTVNGSVNG